MSDSYSLTNNSANRGAGEGRGPLLSILIPVYNEQAYLARIVRRVIDAPLPGNLRRELILVNDASKDRTAEVMEQLRQQWPDLIRVFHQNHNQGKGAAIRRAIKEMSGDFAIIQDADLEYDPNDYPPVLPPLLEGYADAVYASRFATRTMRHVLFYHHKLGNLFLTHLSNFTTGYDLTDMETCYKAFRGEILKSIPLRSNRVGIEPEITAKIAKRGLTVYALPISYPGRRYREGKKIGWKDGFSAIYTILKYWLIDDCWDAEQLHATRLLRTMEYSRNFTRRITKVILPFLGTKIAEVGAGIGTIARALPQRERLLLTDSEDRPLRILKNSYDGNAVVEVHRFDPAPGEKTAVSDAPETDGDIPTDNDTVLFYNQLQKYRDPAAVLRRLKTLLADDGRLIVTVPSHPFLFGKIDQEMGNLRRYIREDLRRVLEEAGFEVETVLSFNRPGFGPTL
ncbi:MAG: glycosyltransferase, partial [Thermoguttaceae bacterium]|nr:glycosyltransferase [Thermoguttaceae bacterium]